MATIKDVAARAGLSVGTVSRVLSGSSKTSADSRRRVFAAAGELGYIAHGPARSLRRSRTDVIGLLVSDIRNPFFSELAHAAEREAAGRGYTVLLANADEDPMQEAGYLRAFAGQRIDGLVLAPQGGDSPQLLKLRASGLPLVLVDRTLDGVAIPSITTDSAAGVRLVLDWLRARGHHEVAYVGGPASLSTGAERRESYLTGRAEVGLSLDPALVDEGDFRVGSGAEAMRRILGRGARPTAVFAADGLMTLGAIQALRAELGDASYGVDLVAFDDLDWFSIAWPPISAVRNDAAEIGRRGVAALVDLIEGRQVSSQRVPVTFVDRAEPGA
ncbi:LacI family DNA-binding transcriptional regulator [Oerskovia sp. Root22]|uniref:LacI family DNA-binding transcriptional regulator n=1 Tax=Oerskovia sp. Root22 TaxID=1736494 RepID=UPI001F3CD64F|nr:LacI family DNA-binding transcriptional regulator [Oerskovia sp. Root22]